MIRYKTLCYTTEHYKTVRFTTVHYKRYVTLEQYKTVHGTLQNSALQNVLLQTATSLQNGTVTKDTKSLNGTC
jgi:hypothetical protein